MRMFVGSICSALGVAFVLATPAVAQTLTRDNLRTVTTLGAADNKYGLGTSVAYFRVAEALTLGTCPGESNPVYIDLSRPSGRAAYQTVQLAKAMGKRLSRIDYYLASSPYPAVCWAVLVEMEN